MLSAKAESVSSLYPSARAARRAGRTLARVRLFALALAALVAAPAGALAQDGGYRKPPQAVLDVLNAPVTPTAFVSPARDRMILATGVRNPSIADVSQPMLRLAGLRINPNTSGRHLPTYYVAYTIKTLPDGAETRVSLPAGAQAGAPEWSGDGKHFAFTNTTPAGIELWLGDAATGRVRKSSDLKLNAVYGDALQWMPDNRALLVQLVPGARAALRPAPSVPREPTIQESAGRGSPVPTFQDLLKNSYDEEQFEYHATAQLALIDAATGRATNIGQPAIYETARPSPDGRHLLTARAHRPFSYLHPISSFPKEVEVWDAAGKLVHKIASHPLQDQIPVDGVQTGPRGYAWRPTEPATLVWVEALDDGDPKKKAEHRDRVVMLKAPFAGTPAELFKTPQRLRGGLQWLETGGGVLVTDYDRDTRKATTWVVNADKPGESRQIWSRNVQDRYNDPGTPVTRQLANNGRVILINDGRIYLSGTGASKEGDRPFLDRLDLATLKAERLFHSDANAYETFVALLDDAGRGIITRRETTAEPPNYFARAVSPAGAAAAAATSAPKPLTNFADPTPQLRGIKKQLVTYQRNDGVPLSFTLYLPPGYKEGTRLPTVVWAYPLEFNDADTAGQVSGSTQRYTTISGYSHLFFLLQGYAVLDSVTMPIVGTPEKANDTYVQQITANAQAAIDKAVAMGVTDRERVGVGGHSYGAFMTANLLAHTDLFRAGIARSGAYNRTLTPFGFQSERRILWEAPETYIKVSPFMVADKIKEPILLIHGEADNNTGTYPIQSERMYQAIRGTGGTARLVMLPHESHGYAARETTEHVLYEMLDWFERHVKNAPSRGGREAASKEGNDEKK